MKKELLCPVGSMDAMHAAVHNGADAIYLAGKSFGARAFAQNFSDEELVNVIKYAHLYDVKVYVTVNTLIKDTEFDEVLKFIEFLHVNNVDAVILQDIGLASIVHKMFPNLELHASTQMHNLDKFSCIFLKNLGFKRVVLARELSIEEIKELDTDLEIEVFIHGALCMSYSGACLLSSMAMNRSGNRGACSQLCRMPYTLQINNKEIDTGGKYLLSPKDLSTAYIFDELMNSNITSLKIEGRMKSKEYVAVVTRMYRKLIDAYYSKTEADIDKEEGDLKKIFNRGYSLGHLKHTNNLITLKRGNHIGVKIGQVTDVNEKFITIEMSDNLHVGDGIKFENSDKGMNAFNIYKNREIIKDAVDGDIITVPNNIGLKDKDAVLKTMDVLLNKELEVYPEKKINIDILVEAKINDKLKVTFSDGVNILTEYGDVVTKAENKSVTKEDINSKILKLGSTAFICDNPKIEIDENIFIRLSELNNIRRVLSDNLTEIRKNKEVQFIKNDNGVVFNKENITETEISCYVRNSKQLEVVKRYPVTRIYTNNYDLYKNNRDLNIYYETNINEDKEFNNDNLLINSTSDLMKYKGNNLILNYGLNTFNSYTINYLKEYGIVTYSPELYMDDIKKIDVHMRKCAELLIYGKVKVMTMKHCLVSRSNTCSGCGVGDSNKELVDNFDRKYKVVCNNKYTYLYDYKNVLKIRDVEEYKRLGIKRFRLDFFDEKESTIDNILKEYFGM